VGSFPADIKVAKDGSFNAINTLTSDDPPDQLLIVEDIEKKGYTYRRLFYDCYLSTLECLNLRNRVYNYISSHQATILEDLTVVN
jgi:hypothetical protein